MSALVLWEVSRKQDYIFRSNKLKENIGASIIIEEAVEELPNSIEGLNGKLIYNGGGGSLYIFKDRSNAEKFIKTVSIEILKKYPGLEFFMVIHDYDNTEDLSIDVVMDAAYEKLAKKKNRRINAGELLSFGIERKCEATGQAASLWYENRAISREICTKIEKSNKRSKKFDKLLPRLEDKKFKSIKEFADIAKGEKKYMAVVHIDGNKMGKYFTEIKKFNKNNEEYFEKLKTFSNEIKKAYEGAFKHMTETIMKNKDKLSEDTYIEEGKFPVIPLIVAGDDITYITNGKIGIETAKIFIEYLNGREIYLYPGKKIKLNACAGVAIVKANYPFSKAYELAEELCKNAKKKITEDYNQNEQDYSLIDWHIEQGELMGSIEEIRKNHYISEDNKILYMRPLYINNKEKWNNYYNFKDALSNITKLKIDEKGIARSKLKNLIKELKIGKKNTEFFLKSNNIENYFSRLENTYGDYCFFNNNCLYYDALEIMDLFIDLSTEEVNE